jgi:hypothetical protein
MCGSARNLPAPPCVALATKKDEPMRRTPTGSFFALSTMMAELGAASFEVIARRTMMMATGACSPAEYQRMVHEKTVAAMTTALRMATSGGKASAGSLLTPWHSRATANAKRLRRV